MQDVGVHQWSDKVGDLLFRCERDVISPSEIVSELHGLMASGPAHICAEIRPEISRSTLQFLLDAGAIESAALRLLTRCGYMLSTDGEGIFIGSVASTITGQEHSYSGSSAAVALCGALAMSLQDCV